MSIFGSIMHKIFGSAPASASPTPGSSSAPAAPTQPGVPADPGAPSTPGAAPSTSGAAPSGPPVDVEAVLTEMSSKNGQNLNWQKSIVDLMKLLGLDSSLEQRKLLADELGYSGDTNDSATMNVWLHKQVMQKLAENGGQVPDSLKV